MVDTLPWRMFCRIVRAPEVAQVAGLEARVGRMMAVRDEADSHWVRPLILAAVAGALLLAMVGARQSYGFSREEMETRRSADPFPGR